MSNINQEIYDLYEQFYRGRLTLEDQKSFESRLKTDDSFKNGYDQFQRDQLLIKELAKSKLREKAKSLITRSENEVNDQAQTKRKWIPWVAMVVFAATIAISSLICFKPSKKISPQQLYASHFELLQPSYQRGASGSEEQFNNAMRFFGEGDYDQTIEALLSMDSDERDIEATFSNRKNLFVGLSYMAKNDHTEAIKALKEVSQESSYYDDAIWYEALSTLQLGQMDEAKAILENLVSKNHYKLKEAKIILENL